MALQVWLPLNGNLDNNGLSNITVTNYGATVDDNGKIGKCYSFDGSDDAISIGNLSTIVNTDFSFSCWFYHDDTWSSKRWETIFGGPSGFELEAKEGGTNSPVIRTYSWGNKTFTYELNKWNNLIMTRTNSETRFYLNGELKLVGTKGNIPSGNYFIGSWNTYNNQNFKGKFNDVRIYDHCLSSKEVKEISKGLILHYPLNDVSSLMSKCSNITWNQLAKPTNASEITSKNVTFSITGEKYINIQTTKDGIEGTGTVIIRTNYLNENSIVASNDVFRQQNNHKYYSPNTLPDGISFTQNVFSGGITPFSGIVQTGKRPSNQNTIQHWSLKGVGGTVIPKQIQCPLMIFDLTLMFGEGNEPTKEEFDMMFPLKYYNYDVGTIKNLKTPIYDCSGYENNGTITGTLSLDSNSPRYKYCTQFGSSKYISPSLWPSFLTNECTISMWIKLDQLPPSSPGRTMLYTAWYGFSCEITSAGKTYFRTYLTNGTVDSPSGNIETENWIHWVGVKSSTGVSLYLNGILIGTTSNTNNFNWSSRSNNRIASYGTSYFLYGKMSDLRLYSTALSEKSIKELYNIGGYVDNSGDVFQYESEERCENLFKLEYWNETINLSRSGNKYVTYTDRNGSKAIALPANWFYYSSSEVAKYHYEGKFKENTQYKFDFWIDYDDIISNNSNKRGGIVVYYTDGTSTEALCGIGNNEAPLGWQHKFFISSPGKSIRCLSIYYYTTTPAFYRWDSTIIEIDNNSTKMKKSGINSTGQFRECSEIAKINKGNHFDTNQIIEI